MLDPMLRPDDVAPERIRPLRAREYLALAAQGAFRDERIELLEGVIVKMSPQHNPHASMTARINRLLVLAIERAGLPYEVSPQLPFEAGQTSVPEPDLAVTDPRDDGERHPRAAYLVVEVAESSLRKDSGVKARIYARARVPEYWIVDVGAREIEVRTEPARGRYTKVKRHGVRAVLRPQQLPGVRIPVVEVVQQTRRR